jgi:hypothetical protein
MGFDQHQKNPAAMGRTGLRSYTVMTCKEIVKKYLQDNGFDGLYEPGECGCDLDDFMPCGGDCAMTCQPGYKTKCDCGEHDFHISLNKPSTE